MLGQTGLLWRGRGLCVVPAWQGLPPSRELLDVSDSPLKAVANILATSSVLSYRTLLEVWAQRSCKVKQPVVPHLFHAKGGVPWRGICQARWEAGLSARSACLMQA